MSFFKKLGSNVPQNNFERAAKQEAEALDVLLKDEHLKNCPYEALYKAEPNTGSYISTFDGRELPRPDLVFYTPEGAVLIDVKNVPVVLERETFINKATREKRNLRYIPINEDIVLPYKEVAKIVGAVEVLLLFVEGENMYLTSIDNCDRWEGYAGKVKKRDTTVLLYYFEDCQPNNKQPEGLYKIK